MKLNKENARLYLNMRNYLYSHGINERAYKTVSEDLLLMLSEAESNGKTAAELFPDGYRVFCDEILKNTVRKNFFEIFLDGLFFVSIMLAIVVLLTTGATALWPDKGESVVGSVLKVEAESAISGACCAFLGGLVSFFMQRNGFSTRKKLTSVLFFVAYVVFAVILMSVASWVGLRFSSDGMFEFSWAWTCVIFSSIALLLFVARGMIAKRKFEGNKS